MSEETPITEFEPTYTVPSHVPSELVVEIDMYDMPGGDEDPHLPWLKFISEEKGSVVFSPYNGGHWVATDPADIARIQADSENFSNTAVSIPDRGSPNLIPLESDAPRHGDYRRNIMPFFKGQALADLQPTIRKLAIDLIDDLVERGECDFLNEFAMRFPVYIVLQILGLPIKDGVELNRLTDIVARHPDPQKKFEAYTTLSQYVDGFIEDRLANPKDDGITKITQATCLGKPYTRDEMNRAATMLTLGGVDSVAQHLCFIALYLARNPDQQDYVRENINSLHGIINEFGRRYPIANIFRKLAKDVELNGITMKAGDMISIAAPIHNFNKELFPSGAEIDFKQRSSAKHLSFGTGPHSCPGASLARLEVKIYLEEWFKRIPKFELKEGAPVRLRASMMSAVDELWLQWPVEAK